MHLYYVRHRTMRNGMRVGVSACRARDVWLKPRTRALRSHAFVCICSHTYVIIARGCAGRGVAVATQWCCVLYVLCMYVCFHACTFSRSCDPSPVAGRWVGERLDVVVVRAASSMFRCGCIRRGLVLLRHRANTGWLFVFWTEPNAKAPCTHTCSGALG